MENNVKTNGETKDVDYKVLKSNIIKSCVAKRHGSIDFGIDIDRLSELVNDYNLIPIATNLDARKVVPENIAYLGEYFEKERLAWFNHEKMFTVVTFIRQDDKFNERAQELLDKMKQAQVDDPDNDKVAVMSELLANYSCYNATVVSYRNDSPRRIGKPSYVIVIRANKVVIKSSDYQYNPQDMS